MVIREVLTSENHEIVIDVIPEQELSMLTKKRYFFDWKAVFGEAILYKLRIKGSTDIKGVMALIEFDKEHRIEIKLLAVSKENVVLKKEKGKKQKEFEGIAECLIAYAGRRAITKFGSLACVSLVPKTEISAHYQTAYGMIPCGLQLSLEGDPLLDLISKY